MRAHGWMDMSFHCYCSLPNPIRWLQESLARWGRGWGPRTQMPTDLGSRLPSSLLPGESRAGCKVKCNQGASRVSQPPAWRLKDLLQVRPSKTAGVPEAKDLWRPKIKGRLVKSRPQGLPSPFLFGRRCGAEVSEWYQPPGQDPAWGDPPPPTLYRQFPLPGPVCAVGAGSKPS